MRMGMRVIAVLAAVFGGAASAWADGMSIKDSPAPVAEGRTCDGGPFAGFYIGAGVGYADQDTQNTDVSGGTGSVSYDDGGFAASVYSGYNIQCGSLVVGYESDWNWMDSDNSFTDPCCYSLSSDVKWFSTSRLRIGLVHSGHMLLYATGGIAFADIDSQLTTFVPAFSRTDDDLRVGWTGGAGFEFILHGQWMLRAEALYMDFGDQDFSYNATALCGLVGCTATQRWEDDIWVARVGLTYKLGAREEEAVPLK